MNDRPGMTKGDFDDKYRVRAPWDIGRPQKVFIDKFTRNPPQSPVLEIACGSGELSIFMASLGCTVLGIDFSEEAMGRAKLKAESLPAAFEVYDAFDLSALGRRFKTIIDCCFFHILDDASRKLYEQVLSAIIEPEGFVYMLGFAVKLPHPDAPRAISRSDLEATFGNRWSIVSAEPSLVEITLAPQGLPGIFTVLKHLVK